MRGGIVKKGGRLSLKINVVPEKKEVELWVSRSDPEATVQEAVNRFRPNYYVIIFRSGTDDLVNSVKGLISNNYLLPVGGNP